MEEGEYVYGRHTSEWSSQQEPPGIDRFVLVSVCMLCARDCAPTVCMLVVVCACARVCVCVYFSVCELMHVC